MKYTIEGFNQQVALDLYTVENGSIIKLDASDLVLLRYFVDFYPNTKKVEINGRQYAWLAYSKVVTDLPLLRIDKRAVSRRLNKLCKLDILTSHITENNQTMFGFGNNYEKLISSGPVLLNTGLYSNEQRGAVPESTEGCTSLNSNNNIINNSINTILKKENKEINKENSEVSETNVHTNDTSPYGNEELTPNPLIRNDLWKLIYDFSTSRKAFTNQVLELLTDYVLARLEQNPSLTVTQLKASIRSLDQVVHECDNPQLFNKYIEQAIINATTGPYAQFKAPFDTSSKNNNSVTEKATKIPFGDHSKCIPATDDIELATDENGNPLKF